jgi:predicted DNA-binding protein
MNNDARFELRLPTQRRARLDELADETGLSSADLVRLAIDRLLADPKIVLKSPQGTEA